MRKRKLFIVSIVLLFSLLLSIPAFSVDTPSLAVIEVNNTTMDNVNNRNNNTTRAYAMNDNTNNTNWGWLGLAGLIGLAGLRNRTRHPER